MPYRAILIDLDGVIRHWDPAVTRAIEERYGLPSGAIGRIAFHPDLLHEATIGALTHREWCDAVEQRLWSSHGPIAREAVRAWSRGIGEIDREMVELVRRLRRRFSVVLVSNATTRLEEDLATHQLLDAFDLIVNSARVGYAKPDERIFRYAAASLGVPLEECIVVDDTSVNVEAAARLGMAAHHFTNQKDLEATIRRRTPRRRRAL